MVPFVVTFVLNASGKVFLSVDVFMQTVFDDLRDKTYVEDFAARNINPTTNRGQSQV